jgi:hypothetical protein
LNEDNGINWERESSKVSEMTKSKYKDEREMNVREENPDEKLSKVLSFLDEEER